MKRKFTPTIPILFTIFAVGLAACRSAAPLFSESIAMKTQERIREEMLENSPHYSWQTFDLLGSSAAMFVLRSTRGVPSSAMEKIESSVTSDLNRARLFHTIKTPPETRNLLSQNKLLNRKKALYLDSLTAVAISDKDIANPMGRYLGVDSFIVFQIDGWPCSECILKDTIRMKIRVVHASSGDIIWTGIGQLHIVTEGSEAIDVSALHLAEGLMEKFRVRFRKKWHKLRDIRLAALANQ